MNHLMIKGILSLTIFTSVAFTPLSSSPVIDISKLSCNEIDKTSTQDISKLKVHFETVKDIPRHSDASPKLNKIYNQLFDVVASAEQYQAIKGCKNKSVPGGSTELMNEIVEHYKNNVAGKRQWDI